VVIVLCFKIHLREGCCKQSSLKCFKCNSVASTLTSDIMNRPGYMPVKGKVVPLRPIEAHLGDRRYSSYSFLTSALEGDEWSASRPGRALPPDKEPPVPTVQEAGWAPEPVWTQRLQEKFSCASVGDRTPGLYASNVFQCVVLRSVGRGREMHAKY
jgi:hypothetical protein